MRGRVAVAFEFMLKLVQRKAHLRAADSMIRALALMGNDRSMSPASTGHRNRAFERAGQGRTANWDPSCRSSQVCRPLVDVRANGRTTPPSARERHRAERPSPARRQHPPGSSLASTLRRRRRIDESTHVVRSVKSSANEMISTPTTRMRFYAPLWMYCDAA